MIEGRDIIDRLRALAERPVLKPISGDIKDAIAEIERLRAKERAPTKGPLSRQQRAILECLMRAKGAHVSRSRLADAVYRDHEDGGPLWGEKGMGVQIFHIRRALGKDVIKTIYGVGWCIADMERARAALEEVRVAA